MYIENNPYDDFELIEEREMDNWIDNSIVIDFEVPRDILYVIKECERLNQQNDYGYFNWAESLSHACKEACVQKHMTKKQWETIERRYPCG